VPIYIIQSFFDDFKSQVYIRHLLTHIYFLFSIFIFFKLLLTLFNSFSLSLVGVFFIYLHPLLFAHSFFNTKDLPFLSTFIISIYTMYLFTNKPNNLKVIILHSFISAFLIDVRFLGFMIPALSIGYVFITNINNIKIKQLIKIFLQYFIFLAIFTYALWPSLWTMPSLIYYGFISMSHYPLPIINLFNGESILCLNNPWNYIPIWIGISTPIIVVLLYIYGVMNSFICFIKEQINFRDKEKILILILSSIPIDLWILFLIIKPSFYDGWRHLYFLGPLIIIGAVQGINSITSVKLISPYKSYITKSFLVIFIITMIFKFVELHPYQQVYMNCLVSKKPESIRTNWEMDYWGLSYKEGFEKLLSMDSSTTIKVKAANISAIDNWKLTKEVDSRIILVDSIKDADYFISNYRFHPKEYPYQRIFSINRQGSRILSIYKISK